jgi:Mitochondrial carrier protein
MTVRLSPRCMHASCVGGFNNNGAALYIIFLSTHHNLFICRLCEQTRIQADPEKYAGGMRQAAAQIIKTDGAQALLGGLGPTVVGYGIEGAMKVRIHSNMVNSL